MESSKQKQSEKTDSEKSIDSESNGSDNIDQTHVNTASELPAEIDQAEFSEVEIEVVVKTEAEAEADEKEDEDEDEDGDDDISTETSSSLTDKSEHDTQVLQPNSQLPKPEAPRGLSNNGDDDVSLRRSQSLSVDVPSIGKFIRERSNNFSAAIVKRLSSLKDNESKTTEEEEKSYDVTEFKLSGLKVVVKVKGGDEQLKGRISFFSRSNCRDCTAVRRFFREKGLKFVEINVDVYPERENELKEKSGSWSVPQIFFNDKYFGGLVALNSLRNSGGFDNRLKDLLGTKCPNTAPAPPVYGFDVDLDEEWTDEMVQMVRFLRQRLPIQDRLMKMKIVKNCFAGSEMLDVLVHHFKCARSKAVEIGKQLARKHFIHHVFGENDFEEGNHFYRFLEHEPFIPKCFNFRKSINDSEPKPAAVIGERLTKIMSAILESYASDDRRHVDYAAISKSEEFRRYVNLAQELHRVNLEELREEEKLAFFLNLYNAMVIHAVIRVGCPEGVMERRFFFSDFLYLVGGHPYSLSTINHGILRHNRRPPYSLIKPFPTGDKRLELAPAKFNPLIQFGLCNGTRSSPTVRFFSPHGVEAELRCAAREFFQGDGMKVDLDKRTVYLSRIIKWFSVDFGNEKDIPKWIINYLDATQAGLLTHLLSDGGAINIVYRNYDWSVNS